MIARPIPVDAAGWLDEPPGGQPGPALRRAQPASPLPAFAGGSAVERTRLTSQTGQGGPQGGQRGTPAGQPGDAADEVRLALRMKDGDAKAFKLIVDRHLKGMLSIARRMLRDDAEAEDVAQEAMIRLWQARATIELGPAGARPWLRRVVSNLCIDRIRAGRRTEVTDEVPEQEVDASQLDGLLADDLAARVDAALKALPERQRLALTLFHFEGMSQVEVGQTIGVSDEAVESLLARARRQMRTMLKDDWKELLGDAT